MTTDIASLALEVDSSQVVQAKEAQQELIASGEKLEKQQDFFAQAEARRAAARQRQFAEEEEASRKRVQREGIITQAQVNATAASQQAAEAWTQQQKAMEPVSGEIQKILNRYDPLGAKLRQLTSDFAALDKAIQTGATGQTPDAALDKSMQTMQEEIKRTKALMVAAGAEGSDSFKKAAAGAKELNLHSVRAHQALIHLGREVVHGDFAAMPLTFLHVAHHTHAFRLLLNPVVLGVLALGAAAVTLGVAFARGAKEVKEMNHAIQITNGFAGMTRGSMRALAEEMTTVSGITIGAAKNIVTQLTLSGQVGATSISNIARIASDFAHATGKDIDKIAPELIKLFTNPAKGAEELNKQMHFLSSAEIERIARLQRMGRLDEAQLELSQKLAAQIPKHSDQLGTLSHAWERVKQMASGAWDAMLGIGRPETLEEAFEKAARKAEELRARANADNVPRGTGGFAAFGRRRDAAAAAAELEREQRRAELLSQGEAAAHNAARASQNRAENEAAALVRQSSEYAKIRDLKDQIYNIERNATPGQDKERALFTLRKQIADLERGMGAEGRAILQGRIEQTMQLREVALQMAHEENDTRLKIKKITQEEHSATKAFLDLQKNAVQQIAVIEQQSVSGLTRQERQKLEFRLQALRAEEQAIKLRSSNQQLVDLRAEQDRFDQMRQKVDQASDTQLRRLDAEIAREKERNAEIGKTAEEKLRVKAAIEEANIAQLRFESDALRLAAATVEMDQRYKDIYIARANALDEEIRKRKELAGVLEMGAFLEKQDAAAKETMQVWRNAAKDMQRSMSSFFFDVMQGNLKNLLGSFKQTIDRMVADALAAKTAVALFGPDFAKGGNLGGIVGSFANGLGSGGGGILTSIGSLFGGRAAGITMSTGQFGAPVLGMPGYAEGTNYVPRTGPYILHEGEAVLTKAENTSSRVQARPITIQINQSFPNGTSRQSSYQAAVAAGERVRRELERS